MESDACDNTPYVVAAGSISAMTKTVHSNKPTKRITFEAYFDLEKTNQYE